VNLLELFFQRRKTRQEANGLLDKAALEFRALSIPEQVRFDSLLARIQDLDVQITQREELRRMA